MNRIAARRGVVLGFAIVSSLFAASCKESPKSDPKPAPSAGAPAAKTVRVDPAPQRVGDKARVGRTSQMRMSVEFWQEGEKLGSQETLRAEEYLREVETLALVGGVSAKEKAHYERYRFKESKPDEPAHEDNSLEGQTYVVDGRDRETKATTADGKSLAPEVMERLERVHAELGVEDKIVAELKGKTIAVGDHTAMRESLFKALVTTAPGEFKSGTIKLAGTRTEAGMEAAVFEWSAEMQTDEENGMETTWHVKGETVVGLSQARTLRATMAADIDVGGHTRRDGKRIDLEGSGSMKDERTWTPL